MHTHQNSLGNFAVSVHNVVLLFGGGHDIFRHTVLPFGVVLDWVNHKVCVVNSNFHLEKSNFFL